MARAFDMAVTVNRALPSRKKSSRQGMTEYANWLVTSRHRILSLSFARESRA